MIGWFVTEQVLRTFSQQPEQRSEGSNLVPQSQTALWRTLETRPAGAPGNPTQNRRMQAARSPGEAAKDEDETL